MAIKGRRPPGAMKKVMTLLESEGRGLVPTPPPSPSPVINDFRALDLSERPVLDNSLPYIPVYTHLITYDPVPIARPVTPAIVKSLWPESRLDSPMRSSKKNINSQEGRKN